MNIVFPLVVAIRVRHEAGLIRKADKMLVDIRYSGLIGSGSLTKLSPNNVFGAPLGKPDFPGVLVWFKMANLEENAH